MLLLVSSVHFEYVNIRGLEDATNGDKGKF